MTHAFYEIVDYWTTKVKKTIIFKISYYFSIWETIRLANIENNFSKCDKSKSHLYFMWKLHIFSTPVREISIYHRRTFGTVNAYQMPVQPIALKAFPLFGQIRFSCLHIITLHIYTIQICWVGALIKICRYLKHLGQSILKQKSLKRE